MMAVPRLVPYIKQQLNAGYDINTIKNYLVRNGYDSREISAAVDYAYGKPSGKFPLLPVVGGIGIALVIGLILFFTLGGEESPAQLLDLETSTTVSEVEAGESLIFNIELVNMGAAKRYDVSITHDLVNSAGDTITTKQETMALETRAAKTSQLAVPDDAAAGSYTVKTTVLYNGQKALSFFTVRIKEEEVVPIIPPVELECPASCDDFDECTTDRCGGETGYECRHDIVRPCCGNYACESGENYDNCPADCEKAPSVTLPAAEETLKDVVNMAKELAVSNPDSAGEYCSGQEKENFRDSCYSAVAETSSDSGYCDFIISVTKRDSCYTTAALNGDFTVCDKIENKYLKQSCQGLAEVSG